MNKSIISVFDAFTIYKNNGIKYGIPFSEMMSVSEFAHSREYIEIRGKVDRKNKIKRLILNIND